MCIRDRDCVVYQKAMAKVRIPDSWQSNELAALGGPAVLAGQAASGATDAATAKEAGAWLAEAPIVILDDDAFRAYCEEIGITPRLDGTIILNQIWDSLHSNCLLYTSITTRSACLLKISSCTAASSASRMVPCW